MERLSEAEERLVERVARTVVARGLAVPAILALESSKPLSFLGSQAMRFLEPAVRTVLDRDEWTTASALLEDRDKVEQVIVRIEARQAERDRSERDGVRR